MAECIKRLLPRVSLICALLLWASPLPVRAQSERPVEAIEIQHIGPAAVGNDLIRANIRVKVGDPYNRASVDQDVRNLYRTGYFHNIRVVEDRGDSGYVLTYFVQAKPLLTDIRFEGNRKYRDKKLRKLVTSKTGEPLDERKLFLDAREIREKYQKAGHQKTEVRYLLNINEELGRGIVTFEIVESPKIKIDDVEFVGAQAFTQRRLRKEVKTRRWWAFSWLTGSGKLKEDQFLEDKEKLADFYRNNGYIDFEIKDVAIDQVNPKRIVVRFIVFEGKQYKVGAVDFEGNELFETEAIIDGIRVAGEEIKPDMTVGETFTPAGLTSDLQAVEDFYESKGYLTRRNRGNTSVQADQSANTERGTMDLEYKIEEGDKSYIEKIEIRGNTKTKDKVIRRELAVTPGETFDMVRVRISRLRLEGLQYFSKVETRPEPTDVPDRKNLVINLEEQNTGNLQVGAGFSSVDAVVGFVELTQGNFDLFNPPYFTGGGQKFRIRTQLGTRRQDYILSFVEPWFLDRRLQFGVELYHRDLQFLSDLYDQTQTGARLSLNKALPRNLEAGVSYTIEQVGIDLDESVRNPRVIQIAGPGRGQTFFVARPEASDELLSEQGNRLVSKVGFNLAHDTRNSTRLPNRGHRTEFRTEVAGGPLGADTDIYKLELRSAWYYPGFFDGHILELSSRGGVVDRFGDSQRVPLFDRWYLGGLYSLRGYRFRDVGPKDNTGEPIGGGTYWFGSAEYSVPIIERLRFAVFYDIGNVYRDAYSFSQPSGDPFYSDNWGVGIRLDIPNLGPLRLDYAFPVTHDDTNSGSPRFQFGVGYTRDF